MGLKNGSWRFQQFRGDRSRGLRQHRALQAPPCRHRRCHQSKERLGRWTRRSPQGDAIQALAPDEIQDRHRSRGTGTVRKAWAAAKIDEQWKENPLHKSIVARRTRATLSDFERFKLSKAKKARNHEIGKAYCALKKAAKA